MTVPPVPPLSADAESLATLLCGRVDCVTSSGAVSLVSIVTQQVCRTPGACLTHLTRP